MTYVERSVALRCIGDDADVVVGIWIEETRRQLGIGGDLLAYASGCGFA